MTKLTYNETLKDLEQLKSELMNCNKNSTVYALDFAFNSEKDLAKHKLTLEQAKDIERKLYKAVTSFSTNCSCKKYK